MDLSPTTERATSAQAFSEMLTEYRPLLLAPDHPTTRYVRRVIGRIVDRNGLGRLKGDEVGGMRKGKGSWGWGEESVESHDEGGKAEGDEVDWEVRLLFSLPGRADRSCPATHLS